MTEHTVELAGNVAMPVVGLGTWGLRGRAARDAVGWALDSGYRHLDTAAIYGNESEIGLALQESGVPRDQVFITTKLPPREVGKERRTLERSLAALRTDYVDLWLVHWPPNGSGVATWEAFAELAQENLTRAIGVSNYGPRQIDELISTTRVIPAVNQVRWSPFIFDRSRLEHSRAAGIVLEGYSPLKASNLGHPLLREVAERHAKTTAQVILRWHLDHGVVVIPKSSRPERIAANIDLFDFRLHSEEIKALDGLSAAT
jgi:diketogulonate reductase-like aldo/keto reductase